MVIVLKAASKSEGHYKLYQFLVDVLSALVEEQQQLRVYAFIDARVCTRLVLQANKRFLVRPVPFSSFLPLQQWHKYVLKGEIAALQPDAKISVGDYELVDQRSPNCILVTEAEIISLERQNKHLGQMRRLRSIKKADKVLTFTAGCRNRIVANHYAQRDAIDIIPPSTKGPINAQQADLINRFKNENTGGCEFFVCPINGGDLHEVTFLLKAFSIFKKRQQCSMRLLFTGIDEKELNKWKSTLDSYRYRGDLVFMSRLPTDEALSIAAAYAAVFVADSFMEIEILHYMEAGIPSILSSNWTAGEIALQASLYYDPADINDLADRLMLVYKDEDMRIRLIEKGKSIAAQFTRLQSRTVLWQILKDAVKEKRLP